MADWISSFKQTRASKYCTHDEERGSPSPGASAVHGPPKVVGDAGERILLLLAGLREGKEGIAEDGVAAAVGVHSHGLGAPPKRPSLSFVDGIWEVWLLSPWWSSSTSDSCFACCVCLCPFQSYFNLSDL